MRRPVRSMSPGSGGAFMAPRPDSTAQVVRRSSAFAQRVEEAGRLEMLEHETPHRSMALIGEVGIVVEVGLVAFEASLDLDERRARASRERAHDVVVVGNVPPPTHELALLGLDQSVMSRQEG